MSSARSRLLVLDILVEPRAPLPPGPPPPHLSHAHSHHREPPEQPEGVKLRLVLSPLQTRGYSSEEAKTSVKSPSSTSSQCLSTDPTDYPLHFAVYYNHTNRLVSVLSHTQHQAQAD